MSLGVYGCSIPSLVSKTTKKERVDYQTSSPSANFLLLPHRVESFSFGNRLLNLLRPSSTKHLADLLELYDVVQDPSFLASSEEWRSSFSSILTDVEVTSQGVVEGLGLIARRDFSAGEVVALYPYVAFFYIQIPGQS